MVLAKENEMGEKWMTGQYGVACALYDGGWRAADYDALKVEYDYTDDEAEKICEYLKEIEIKNQSDNE